MNDSFLALNKHKQECILDAAYTEFIKLGYKKASTNNIVKAAGIGKGMLFHYFNSKQELFDDLIEMSLKYVQEKFISKISQEKMDLISRYEHITSLKMKALLNNPNAFNFLGSLYIHGFENVPEKYTLLAKEMMQQRQDMMTKNVDITMLIKNGEKKSIMNIIRWSIDGYTNEIIAKLKGQNLSEIDYSSYVKEFQILLNTLRKLCYEKEEFDEFAKS